MHPAAPNRMVLHKLPIQAVPFTLKGTAFNCVVELLKKDFLTIRPRQEDCWFGVYNIPSVIRLCRCWFSTVDVQTHFQTCPRPAAVETCGWFTRFTHHSCLSGTWSGSTAVLKLVNLPWYVYTHAKFSISLYSWLRENHVNWNS